MTKNLSLLSQNVRSLRAGFEELEYIVHRKKPMFVFVQETWQVVTGNPLLHNYQQPQFNLRSSGKRGGGVGFWVANGINFESKDVKHLIVDEIFECISVKAGKF